LEIERIGICHELSKLIGEPLTICFRDSDVHLHVAEGGTGPGLRQRVGSERCKCLPRGSDTFSAISVSLSRTLAEHDINTTCRVVPGPIARGKVGKPGGVVVRSRETNEKRGAHSETCAIDPRRTAHR